MLRNTAIIFSGIVNRKLRVLPAYLTLLVANALPVWGAATGRLLFFQIIYLYWFEGFLLVLFDCVRIMTARGIGHTSGAARTLPQKFRLAMRTVVIRSGLLLFYLLFLVLFIGFRITGKAHTPAVAETLVFRNPFFNASIAVFGVNMVVQLVGGFFLNGKYRTEPPEKFASVFDGRTILIHVMLVGSVFIHQAFFEGKSYEAAGEIAYVGIFMLIKIVADLTGARERFAEDRCLMPMS